MRQNKGWEGGINQKNHSSFSMLCTFLVPIHAIWKKPVLLKYGYILEILYYQSPFYTIKRHKC